MKRISISRFFSTPGEDVLDQISWLKTDITVTNQETGETLFEQKGVEYPAFWSEQAIKIVAQKYFYGSLDPQNREFPDEREYSVKQLVRRIVKTYSLWAQKCQMFQKQEHYEIFEQELAYLLVHQKASFNSPVWFNLGLFEQKAWGRPDIKGKKLRDIEALYCWDEVCERPVRASYLYEYPNTSACYVLSISDDMDSILNHFVTEGKIFFGGSGIGVNISSLRSSFEPISGRGKSSGPLSFDRGWDKSAGAIKSGGRTRRAARLVAMNVWHPDIRQFVTCKQEQEKIAHILIQEHGYDGSMDGLVLGEVLNFQNSNHSVVMDAAFLKAVRENGEYSTRWVTKPSFVQETFLARDLFGQMVDSLWEQGEPGFQFTDTINKWNTCPNSGKIRTSNPCGEYLFLDNTACNLMAVNILKFWQEEKGTFDIDAFESACRILILCGELNVRYSGLPTEDIAENVGRFRNIGLGYGNLHALVRAMGFPYDSDEARVVCGLVTGTMTATAYLTSVELAETFGPFSEYSKNREAFLNVMKMHRKEVSKLEYELEAALDPEDPFGGFAETWSVHVADLWDHVIKLGKKHGFRNAQVTLLAPLGTTGFMMDLDSFGIEPEFGLVVYKQLSGGGALRMVSKTMELALRRLGYQDKDVKDILSWVDEHDTIEGASQLEKQHLSVFDCAVTCGASGKRSISPAGHIKMLATAQRFISGGISKTINVPQEASKQDLWDLILEAEKLGVKALTIYRYGSRGTAPLSTLRETEPPSLEEPTEVPTRVALPAKAISFRQKFRLGESGGYLHLGFYPSGRIGEVFLTINKEGDTVSGFAGVFAKLISQMLQCGVPLKEIVASLGHTKFEPSGFTGVQEVPYADSPVDFVVRFAYALCQQVQDKGMQGLMSEITSRDTLSALTEPMLESTPEPSEPSEPSESPEHRYIKCPRCQNPNLRDADGCPSCPLCGWSAGCGGS